MKVFYDKDCDLSVIKGKTVAMKRLASQSWKSLMQSKRPTSL